MKLPQKIFGIGLLTAVIAPHLSEKGYINFFDTYKLPFSHLRSSPFIRLHLRCKKVRSPLRKKVRSPL
ncbi:hypothetical protein H6F84_16655 [Microcoleus sp. FACHB-84]|nr:hypothetical protein [Microcoleus sp. FACHB-84]